MCDAASIKWPQKWEFNKRKIYHMKAHVNVAQPVC